MASALEFDTRRPANHFCGNHFQACLTLAPPVSPAARRNPPHPPPAAMPAPQEPYWCVAPARGGAVVCVGGRSFGRLLQDDAWPEKVRVWPAVVCGDACGGGSAHGARRAPARPSAGRMNPRVPAGCGAARATAATPRGGGGNSLGKRAAGGCWRLAASTPRAPRAAPRATAPRARASHPKGVVCARRGDRIAARRACAPPAAGASRC